MFSHLLKFMPLFCVDNDRILYPFLSYTNMIGCFILYVSHVHFLYFLLFPVFVVINKTVVINIGLLHLKCFCA